MLGKAGAGKSKVAKVILGDTNHNEECEECFLHEGEHSGRRVCIVDTPGWDRVSIKCTTKQIKNEITRSVMLCPPGPHALILVLPVNTADAPSLNELKSASQHVELLSERVWDHTMVLFLCDENVENCTIEYNIQKADKLLEKCRDRHYVMRESESETQVHELLKEIDSMVEENLGDFFLPQVYYEVIQSKIPQDIRELEKKYKEKEEILKQTYQKRLGWYKKQAEKETGPQQRRGSVQGKRPSCKYNSVNVRLHLHSYCIFPGLIQLIILSVYIFAVSKCENQAGNIDAIERKYRDELQALARHYIKPISLIVLTGIGALIGSVVGSNYGVMGSGFGIVIGVVVTIPLALGLIKAASLVRQSSTLFKERKSEHND